MSQGTQISAAISTSTKAKLDRFTEASGLKKNYVVEQALLFFMESRAELPDEAFVPTRVVASEDPFARIAARLSTKPRPTPELKELARGTND